MNIKAISYILSVLVLSLSFFVLSCGSKESEAPQSKSSIDNKDDAKTTQTKSIVSDETKKFAPANAVFEFDNGKRIGKVNVDVPKDNSTPQNFVPKIVSPQENKPLPSDIIIPSRARPDPVKNRSHRGKNLDSQNKK